MDEIKDIAESLRRISKILAGLLLRDIEDGDQKGKNRAAETIRLQQHRNCRHAWH